MEDDLKVLKVKYQKHPWSDLTLMLNLSLGDQTKIENCLKWRWPSMEDYLTILKVEYIWNSWLDLTQILIEA